VPLPLQRGRVATGSVISTPSRITGVDSHSVAVEETDLVYVPIRDNNAVVGSVAVC
jgi:hypothetical protein